MNRDQDHPDFKPAKAPRVFAVASGKGGVGKTNLAANLAVTLALMQKRVLVFDADMGLANLDVLFGLAPRQNLRHALDDGMPLEDLIIEGPGGIDIIPAGSGVPELADCDPTRSKEFITELGELSCKYDVLMLDIPAGIGSNARRYSSLADELLVVTTPEPTAVTDAYAFVKVMRKENPKLLMQLYVNMAGDLAEAGRVARAFSQVTERFLGEKMPCLGGLPWDECIPLSVRRQQPFVSCFPEGESARLLRDLGRRMLGTKARSAKSPFKPQNDGYLSPLSVNTPESDADAPEDSGVPSWNNRIARWMDWGR